ncbi:hypothetical protein H6503_02660 [Candidatus Woesearchaeota archaeon]|nr:hypothetical protein [Candidatus Woesearchaeota archaeon]
MAKLQHIINKKQKKEAFLIGVPKEIVKLLRLKKGQEFAVRFNEERGSVEYIPIRK